MNYDSESFNNKLASCQNLIIFTGSGSSAGSGIPTFRGGRNSWWESFFGMLAFPVLATGWGWKHIPTISWFLYDWFMRGRVLRAMPHCFHRWTRRMQDDQGKNVTIITQNVDGIHQKSMIKKENVFELHGTLWNSCCSNTACSEMYSKIEPVIILAHESVPKVGNCPKCGSSPRPGALLFNDRYFRHSPYPEFDFSHLNKENTLVLIVGLSGVIGSSNYYIDKVVEKCGKESVFVIDPNQSVYTTKFGDSNWINCAVEDFDIWYYM